MNILGLSFGYHDSAAAMLIDGQPTFFASEERYSHRKNDSGLPSGAVAAALDHTGLSPEEIDSVVYYEDPLLKVDRIANMARRFHPDPDRYVRDLLRGNWDRKDKLDPVGAITELLGIEGRRVHHVDHHLSHAALAYFLSPFDRAIIITIDGVGEYESLGVYLGEGGRIERKASMRMPDSVGLLYSFFTGFCGFEVNEGEYKLMGLAAFGEPTFADEIGSWVDLGVDRLSCGSPDIQWAVPSDNPVTPAFEAVFGKAFEHGRDDYLDTRFTAIAASVQGAIESEILKLIQASTDKWNCENICLGGGVALNCNVNGRIRREITPNLFVPPAPGDAGSALGAAFAWAFQGEGNAAVGGKPDIRFSPYLGGGLDEERFKRDLPLYRPLVRVETIPDGGIVERTAECLAAGEVVGWMQGRFEMGPRALGNRSILADPRTLEMKDTVNRRIKQREMFRPFAPSILEAHADRYFDLPSPIGLGDRAPERFMLATHKAREETKDSVRAVIHVDDTSRVHVVAPGVNPLFHDLIEAFGRRTGVPVLLNTSLNIAGQPMASDALSGMRAFLYSDMDRLVIGDHFITKRD
jgi:carbamoyltransferase